MKTRRDAIIYFPSLSKAHSSDSIDTMANRLVGAFDRNAQSGESEFYVKKTGREEFREFKTPLLTIMRKDDQDVPVADLYELDYRDLLISSAKERRPAIHLLSILLNCLGMFPRLISAIGRTGKTSIEKWQVFYGWSFALIVSLYFFILAVAFISTISEFLSVFSIPDEIAVTQTVDRQSTIPAKPITADQVDGDDKYAWVVSTLLQILIWFPSGLVIISAAFGMFLKLDFKKLISDLGIELTAADNYLSVDEKRGRIRGQFASLLEHIAEKEAQGLIQYENIHIVSYSFGSIIAIDALFPNDNPLVPRFQLIDTLTTIGTPYDFISTYWPNYFKNRMQYKGTPKKWINIYMKSDVFGSNFTDSKSGKPQGIEFHPEYISTGEKPKIPDVNRISGPNRSLKDYSWFNRVKLIGFKNHSRYWDDDTGFDINSIDIVVQEIYKNRRL